MRDVEISDIATGSKVARGKPITSEKAKLLYGAVPSDEPPSSSYQASYAKSSTNRNRSGSMESSDSYMIENARRRVQEAHPQESEQDPLLHSPEMFFSPHFLHCLRLKISSHRAIRVHKPIFTNLVTWAQILILAASMLSFTGGTLAEWGFGVQSSTVEVAGFGGTTVTQEVQTPANLWYGPSKRISPLNFSSLLIFVVVQKWVL